VNGGLAKLLNRLQNGTHRGKGGAADQLILGRMGLTTACKEETLRMKNVSIESSGGKQLCLWVIKLAVLDSLHDTCILVAPMVIHHLDPLMPTHLGRFFPFSTFFGASQGYTLGPLSFIICINDIYVRLFYYLMMI
jgi:hypothetical protein